MSESRRPLRTSSRYGSSGVSVDDIAAFIESRLAEDEAAAKAAEKRHPTPWKVGDDTPTGGLPVGVWLDDSAEDVQGVAFVNGSSAASHIARHDPATVLRAVEAKRLIVGLMQVIIEGYDRRHHSLVAQAKEHPSVRFNAVHTLRLLASEWSDHESYWQEWRP